MKKAVNLFLVAGFAALVVAPIAYAGTKPLLSVTLQDPLPANSYSTDRFTCVSEAGVGTEVIAEYETVLSGPGEHVSRLKRMVLGDKALTAEQVAHINEFVDEDTITGASAGCVGNNVHLSIQVFRADSIAPTACLADGYQYISVYLERDTGLLRIE